MIDIEGLKPWRCLTESGNPLEHADFVSSEPSSEA